MLPLVHPGAVRTLDIGWNRMEERQTFFTLTIRTTKTKVIYLNFVKNVINGFLLADTKRF